MARKLPPTARETIIERIRKAKGLGTMDAANAAWQRIDRSYTQRGTLSHEAVLERLEDRLRDYDARVFRCTREAVSETIVQVLRGGPRRRMLIPHGLPAEWLPTGLGFAGLDITRDDDLTTRELNECDGILSGSAFAIAETGTVVLQSVPGQGRRAATLVPDYHLCVVDGAAVVETVPEAIQRLQKDATVATTFFSGPSATADIEMTRIKGVHGPRFLDVVLIVD